MDKFQEMRTFVGVVEAGSFVGASDALAMSKPAVSRYVGELEARLGVRLLQRTTRQLALTEEGQVFFTRAKELLAQIDEAESEITSRSGEATGHIKLSAPVIFGELCLAPLWAKFMARHPKVTLDVSLSDRMVDLVDESFDVAVRIARLPNSSLISRKLATTHTLLCASPEYLRKHGTPEHPTDLTKHATLGYTLAANGDQAEFIGPDGPVWVKFKPRFHSNSGQTCRVGALNHMGIICQPEFLVGRDLAAGKLVEVMPSYRPPELGIYAIYPTRKHVASKVRLLIDFLVAALATRSL